VALTARAVLRMMSGALMVRPSIGGLVEVQRPMENLLTLGTYFYNDLCRPLEPAFTMINQSQVTPPDELIKMVQYTMLAILTSPFIILNSA